jgi:3-phosphoshikimate 1-carboxyvinyltransferase
MIAVIHPSSLSGKLVLPASKSVMQRICALALLHPGETIIRNPGQSNDDRAALSVIQALGARVLWENDVIRVHGVSAIECASGVIHCGESGLSARLFTLLAAMSQQPVRVEGSGTLTERDMRFFDAVMPQLGVSFRSAQGKLPFEVQGLLHPTSIRVDGSASSQYISGLLLAYGALTRNSLLITVDNLVSKPYVDLTVTYMRRFGYQVNEGPGAVYEIGPRTINLTQPVDCTVEGDWSAASFFLAAAAQPNNAVHLSGLNLQAKQADRAMLDVLQQVGIHWQVTANELHCKHPGQLHPFRFDATHAPDLFPPLVALAAGINGTSEIKGTHRLINKESNRLQSLLDVFNRLGVTITASGDSLLVQPGKWPTETITVSSHHDHRIAMAVSIWALQSSAAVRIEAAEAVEKSYPGFYSDLRKLGAEVHFE